MALFKSYEIKEQGSSAIMDKQAWDLQHSIVELNVPESVSLAFLELDTSLPEFTDAMYELLPALIGDAAAIVGPPFEPRARCRLDTSAKQALPEDVETMQAGVR